MIEQQQQDIRLLTHMMCELREKQSSVRVSLDDLTLERCKKGILALENAIEALQVQVYA